MSATGSAPNTAIKTHLGFDFKVKPRKEVTLNNVILSQTQNDILLFLRRRVVFYPRSVVPLPDEESN